MKKSKYSFALIALIVSFIVIQIVFLNFMYNDAIENIGENAKNISKVVIQLMDVDEYKTIIETREKTSYFYDMQKKFKNIKESVGAEFVYVERRLNDNEMEYIFDSQKDSFGEIEREVSPLECSTENIGSFQTKIVNYKMWGQLLSGFTQIIDKDGNVVGLVGVDYTLNFTIISFNHDVRILLFYSLIILIYGVLAYLILKKKRQRDKDVILNFYDSIVKTLSHSLNKKSEYTWQHSLKVGEYSEILAREFGFCHRDIKSIKWASNLHDIGKIGIPESILNKNSSLTEEEYGIIKQHPVFSKEILSEMLSMEHHLVDSRNFNVIIEIATYHHERWDGKGYPYGIKGENIPLESRIVSVVDAWEAMTSERPYKKQMSREKAIVEIEKNSGSQFDPAVVDAFIRCLNKKLI